MKKFVKPNRIIRFVAAGLWLAGLAVCPPAGEAALPTHPQPSASAAADNAADRVWQRVNKGTSAESMQKNKPQQERVARPIRKSPGRSIPMDKWTGRVIHSSTG